ncbi:unnamed protein product [Ambrosiozyma monospora]|uniref:Unnamed protein product n=1 Tax=Ambrosiozyma monospora TaxID=43982 RepID=A0ACB5TD69_AMBMO|nr:unnamed protein product [Ambrosiozyma monospora]
MYYSNTSRLSDSVNSRDGLVSPDKDYYSTSPTKPKRFSSRLTHVSPVRKQKNSKRKDDYNISDIEELDKSEKAKGTAGRMPSVPMYDSVSSSLFPDEDESDSDSDDYDYGKDRFNPYPTFDKSFYPVDKPKRKYYDPFEMNKYDDDADSREGVDVDTIQGDSDSESKLPDMPDIPMPHFPPPQPQPGVPYIPTGEPGFNGAFNEYSIPEGRQVVIEPLGDLNNMDPAQAEYLRNLIPQPHMPIPPPTMQLPMAMPPPGMVSNPGSQRSSGTYSSSYSSTGRSSTSSGSKYKIPQAPPPAANAPVAAEAPVKDDDDVDDALHGMDQVEMVNGNLILDCHVSDLLFKRYPIPISPAAREFLYMRYQAVTCQPPEFMEKHFSLRQRFYLKPRTTELLICITMFNESEVALAKTLKGVFKNIRYLYSLKKSSVWGQDAWQKVVVCIVSDGRKKINPKALALLGTLGVYQAGFAKGKVSDKPVVAHVYEYTTMVGILKVEDDHVKLTTKNQVPIQMVFCLKENNQRKINSHSWAFEAFCPELNPNVVVLLDVGTEPESKSIYKLWRAFKDDRVAGACGEIKATLGPGGKLLTNPLI